MRDHRMSEARVQCYALLRCCRPPVCGHPDTCFCVPLVARGGRWRRGSSGGGPRRRCESPRRGRRRGGYSDNKISNNEIDWRTDWDWPSFYSKNFDLVLLQWNSPSDRRRISLPAPFCQEGVPSLSIKQRGARQARPGRPAAAGFPPHQAAAKTLGILHSSICSRYRFKRFATSFHPQTLSTSLPLPKALHVTFMRINLKHIFGQLRPKLPYVSDVPLLGLRRPWLLCDRILHCLQQQQQPLY